MASKGVPVSGADLPMTTDRFQLSKRFALAALVLAAEAGAATLCSDGSIAADAASCPALATLICPDGSEALPGQSCGAGAVAGGTGTVACAVSCGNAPADLSTCATVSFPDGVAAFGLAGACLSLASSSSSDLQVLQDLIASYEEFCGSAVPAAPAATDACVPFSSASLETGRWCQYSCSTASGETIYDPVPSAGKLLGSVIWNRRIPESNASTDCGSWESKPCSGRSPSGAAPAMGMFGGSLSPSPANYLRVSPSSLGSPSGN
jgi:hypothetical protein